MKKNIRNMLSMLLAALVLLCSAALAEVYVPDPTPIPPAGSLQLNAAELLTLVQGDTFDLVATTIGAGATITWDTSDADVVSVASSGRDERSAVLTAKQVGTAIISANAQGGVSKYVTVQVVTADKPQSVSLNHEGTVEVNLGDTLQLEATLSPDTARSELTWKTAKKAIATVDETGLVTPQKTGTVRITVTTANKKSARVTIKVVDPYKPTSVAFEQDALTVNLGETLTLHPVLSPDDAKTVYKWKSSNSKVAKVDENGVVTPQKEGKATVTVTTANSKKATIKIEVVDTNKPTAVRFDIEGAVLPVGAKGMLTPLLTPEESRTTYSWKSSKSKVVRVTKEGVITCLKKGKATITVTTANKLKATMEIQVVGTAEEASAAASGWIWPVHAAVTVEGAELEEDTWVSTEDEIVFRWEVDGSVSGFFLYVDHVTGDDAETFLSEEGALVKELRVKRSEIVVDDDYTFDLGVLPLAGDNIDMSWTNQRFRFTNESFVSSDPIW
ncbi:MAG: Ig domain-containing protein [Clostridia bacterium]|nr:Ig domain-containing protein [Clostridia bacterium]